MSKRSDPSRFPWLLLILVMAGCAAVEIRPLPLPTQAPLAAVPATAAIASATATALPPQPTATPTAPPPTGTALPSPSPTPPPASATPAPSATPQPSPTEVPGTGQVIGYSHDGRPITSYRFGRGPRSLVLVGGIHGGYEWNTILLAYELLDYFRERPQAVPPAVTLYLIPSPNPDGQAAVTGSLGRFDPGSLPADTFAGRFNGRQVDLNRNWDCDWSATALWRGQPISGGRQPFSEPETQALRDFLLDLRPALVLFYHSAANGVFAAGCPDTFAPTWELAQLYGQAAGYPAYERFAFYPVSGDAGDWLATQEIPSISVELKDHQDSQYQQNLAGVLALLDYFGRP